MFDVQTLTVPFDIHQQRRDVQSQWSEAERARRRRVAARRQRELLEQIMNAALADEACAETAPAA